jgi:hypothetical protein
MIDADFLEYPQMLKGRAARPTSVGPTILPATLVFELARKKFEHYSRSV